VEEALTLEEAEKMYLAAKANRAKSGFVHSFAPDYYGDKPYDYRKIEV